MNGNVEILPTSVALIHTAAERIVSIVLESVRARGRAMIALAGGSTPKKIYALVGSGALRSKVSWENVQLFWGDERCVVSNDPESNFRMVNDSLLKNVSIPPQNVHRIKTEMNLVDAAREYEMEIRKSFHTPAGLPRFDLVLLGLGEDGHVASLFPGTTALDETGKLVTEVYVGRLNAFRVTLTLPVINNAHHVVFLVSGKGKSAVFSNIARRTDLGYPAQRVLPVAGELQWLVDADAASALTKDDR